MIRTTWFRYVPLGFAIALASGCGAPAEVGIDEDVGQVGIYLSSVPSNGTCVRFTTLAGSRTIQQAFDAMSGSTLTAALRGLPYGVSLSISAEAFSGACAELGPASLATYLSNTQTTTLVAGETKSLAFTLRPTGNVNGTADFVFITMTPASQSLASTFVGQEGVPSSFTVTNIGMVPTSPLSASIIDPPYGGAMQFSIASNTCAAGVEPSATCTVQVRMTPSSAGSKTATLQVSGTTGGTVTAGVSGTGLGLARLTIPPMTNFTNVPLGTPMTGLITISNAGDEPTGVLDVALSPQSPELSVTSNTCTPGAPLGARQGCTVFLRYAPTAIGSLVPTTLTVTASPGGTATNSISGNCVSPLFLTPVTANLGASPVGTAGMSQTFTLRNNGNQTSAALAVSVSSGDFRITSDGCNARTVAAYQTCTITVQAVPSAAGAVTGTLTVNGAPGWTAQATLTASGT